MCYSCLAPSFHPILNFLFKGHTTILSFKLPKELCSPCYVLDFFPDPFAADVSGARVFYK
jgi:hypothetical protein